MKHNRKTLEFTKPKQRGNNRRRLVFFLTGFVIFALLAGAASLYLLWRNNDYDFSRLLGTRRAVEETTQPPTQEQTTETGATEQEIPITVFRVLAVCRDESGKMSFLFVFEVDVTGRKVNIIPISEQTEMICSGKTMTAGEICSTPGYSVREAYAQTYERKIDKYIEMNETAFKSLVKELGNVTVYVEKDVPYDEDGVTYTIRAGLMSLTPDMLLRYMKYADTPEDLTVAQARAAQAILETYVTIENVLKGTDLFSELANLVTTDITALEFNNNYALLTDFVSGEMSFTSDCPD